MSSHILTLSLFFNVVYGTRTHFREMLFASVVVLFFFQCSNVNGVEVFF